MNRAVFTDRDGVLNLDSGYVYRVQDLEFYPGVKEGIKNLKRAGFLVIVVSNQSGIGRGYFTVNDVERFHQAMNQQLEETGVKIDAFYICPHHPDEGCTCRKPSPELILKAAEEFQIELASSYFIGDTVSDMLAGKRAGCRTILVATGKGETPHDLYRKYIDYYCADFKGAVDLILSKERAEG